MASSSAPPRDLKALYEYFVHNGIGNVLLELLNLKEIGRLDSSNTNSTLRESFLERMGQFKSALFTSLKPRKKDMLQWLIKRGISNVKIMIFNKSSIPLVAWFFRRITMPNLKTIQFNFGGYKGGKMSDVSLNLIGNACPRLNTIIFNYCDKITDAGVIALVEKCPELEIINLNKNGGDEINASLVVIGKKCPKLRSINLSGCKMVTDEGLKGLCQGCPELKTINLNYCDKITDAGVLSLCEKCLKLKKIRLSGCPLVTNKCRASLKLRGSIFKL